MKRLYRTKNHKENEWHDEMPTGPCADSTSSRLPESSSNPEPLFEMARVGFMDGYWEVYVWTDDPGYIPHVHIRDTASKGAKFETCVRLDINRYFLHGHATDKMNSSMRKAFHAFMMAPCQNPRYSNHYDFAVDMWNANNSSVMVTPSYDAQGNIKVPDYTTIGE